jgi:hypothetical protein
VTHPTVADLVERSGDDAVRAHLATCPPCRARAALLADLDGSDPGPLALELARHRAVSSLSPEPDDGALAPGAVVDRWVVEARLGAGGMGTVYRVRHQHLGSLAALKVLHRRVDHALQEGRAQGRLTHPHVVGVTDVVEVQGGPALVMELVPGPTLAEHLRAARGPLPAAEVDEIARGVLRGGGGRPPRGPGAPRPQARERAPGARGRPVGGEGRGLRAGARTPGRLDARGPGGDAGVHGAGAAR